MLKNKWIQTACSFVLSLALLGPTASVLADVAHTVADGENASSIAAYYGISTDLLMRWNALNDEEIEVGRVIYVPTQYSDTYIDDSNNYDSSYYYEDSDTGSYYEFGATHVVNPGDTLWDLAWFYGTDVDSLMAVNGLYSDWLMVGDVLTIPQGYIDPGFSYVYVDEPEYYDEGTVTKEEVAQEEVSTSQSPQTSHTPTPAEEQPKADQKTHTVKENENIWTIAKQYHISAASLRAWNNLKPEDKLTPGQKLYITNPAQLATVHKVKEGETLEEIAKQYATTVDLLMEWNQLKAEDDFKVGDNLLVSDPDPKIHTAIPGQTVEEVAAEYGIDPADLRKWNKLPEKADLVNGDLIVSDPTGVKN